jgi:solute:Na+ symporter, SSS family
MKLIFIILYLSIQLIIAFFISKKIKTEKDFLLAGKNLPLWLLSFSLFATWFGAETCIGTSGAVFKQGLSGSRADPFGYSICLFALGLFLTKQLWQGGYVTLADFFKNRFDSKIEKLGVLIIVPSTLLWGAAQMRAFGQVVSSMTDWDLNTTLWIAFAFVTFYTLLGGLLGDIVTDLIQGIMIAIGLSVILYYVLASDFDLMQWWQNLDPQRLSLTRENESFMTRVDRWMIPILGSLVAQELISRILAARSAKIATQSAYASGIIYLIFGSIPVILGLIGPEVMSELTHREDFIIKLAEKFLPPFAYVLFSGALISAILATIDSILLSSSALISHNVIVPLFKLTSEKWKIFSARFFIVFSSLVSVAVAFSSESIYQLVESASSFGTAGVLVITVCGLHFKWGGILSAYLALFAGLITMPVAQHVLKLEAPFVTTILVSLILYILGGLNFFNIATKKLATDTQRIY